MQGIREPFLIILKIDVGQYILDSSDSKESICDAGDLDSISGLGRSPGEENGYLLQYSGLENSMD